MSPTTETKTLAFIFGSGLLHITTVAAISMMNLQTEKPKLEMIEFEVASSQGVQTEMPATPPAPEPAPAKPVVSQPESTVAQNLPTKIAVAESVQETAAEPVPEVVAEPTQNAIVESTQEVNAEPAEEALATAEAALATAEVSEAVVTTETVQTSESVAPIVNEIAQSAPATNTAPAENGTQTEATGAAFGVAEGVRQLEQLKQKPGNKKPTYDREDRLRGRQGKVSLLAYISRDGRPVQFKMLQSSGHRSLDLKTLAAVKSWRFYPGQEGWVEIPIQWDLRGGPQEAPATLRRHGKIN